jgi:hypothetical protein
MAKLMGFRELLEHVMDIDGTPMKFPRDSIAAQFRINLGCKPSSAARAMDLYPTDTTAPHHVRQEPAEWNRNTRWYCPVCMEDCSRKEDSQRLCECCDLEGGGGES